MANWHNSPSLREAALLAGKQYVADVEAGVRKLCIEWWVNGHGCLVGEMMHAVRPGSAVSFQFTPTGVLGLNMKDLDRAISHNDTGNPRAGLEYLASLPFGEE